MSMDLDFWKYKENVPHNHTKVYEKAVCEGELLDELETLPVDEILKAVATLNFEITPVGASIYLPFC